MNVKQTIKKRDPIVLLAVVIFALLFFLRDLIVIAALTGVFLFGIVVLVRGTYPVAPGKRIHNREARICGWIYVLSFLVCVVFSWIFISYCMNKGNKADYFFWRDRWLLFMIQSLVLSTSLVVAQVLANHFYSRSLKTDHFSMNNLGVKMTGSFTGKQDQIQS